MTSKVARISSALHPEAFHSWEGAHSRSTFWRPLRSHVLNTRVRFGSQLNPGSCRKNAYPYHPGIAISPEPLRTSPFLTWENQQTSWTISGQGAWLSVAELPAAQGRRTCVVPLRGHLVVCIRRAPGDVDPGSTFQSSLEAGHNFIKGYFKA